jgi:hypothetical protein
MSIYISPNNEYPRHIGDIKIENPEWQEGDQLPDGWTQVVPTEAPVRQEGAVVYEVAPVETNGVFYQTWATRELTTEELQAQKIAGVRRKVMMNLPLTEEEALLLVG